ncbi:MAG: hypothetical protein PHV93_02750 [Candidatus Pacebacteria bacterium]|nr:hypothetical protein [Candidatus Paceibacterota bacterium]
MVQQIAVRPIDVVVEALRAARKADGAVNEVGSPIEERSWNTDVEGGATWKSMFGNLHLQVSGFRLEFPEAQAQNMWAAANIDRGDRPSAVRVLLSMQAVEGAKVLHCAAGEVTDVTAGSMPDLVVPVVYDGAAPRTREKDKDNIDIVILQRNGMFVQLQVSVITRGGVFYVGVQEIFAGQVVRTNASKVLKLGLKKETINGAQVGLIVPLFEGNAYPGADYLNVFPRMGPKVIKYAVAHEMCVPLSECVVAKWAPEETPLPPNLKAEDGWMRAVVRSYNLVTGCGHLLCDDGVDCFLHFSVIGGDFPSVPPMKAVAVQHWLRDNRRKALKFQSL